MMEESLARSIDFDLIQESWFQFSVRKFDGNLYDPPSDLREILRFVSDVVLDSVFHLMNCLQFISI